MDALGGERDHASHWAELDDAAAELRRRRQSLGLTQADLARALGVTANTVARWERGEQRLSRPERVERVLSEVEAARGGARAEPEPLPFPNRQRRARAAAAPAPPVEPNPLLLVVELNSFIGREHELAELTQMLRTQRLVTLTGPGGVGKTRLALHVAHALADGAFSHSHSHSHSHGVWPVELSDVRDPRLVGQVVAAALQVPLLPGRPVFDSLVAALRSRHQLLLLDNCEHLIGACAELAEAVLRSCPQVTLLVTSRQPLGIAAEVVWRVSPLSLPEDADLEHTRNSAAVRLLVDRIRTHDHAFQLTDRTAARLAEICRRLDGLPLALELAAARVPQLGLDQVAARLDDRFRLLTHGRRTAPLRHQTLRATLEFDQELLSEPERRLLRRLSVFVGGFDLAAAEAVGGGDGLPTEHVVDLIDQLAERALVTIRHNGDVRYGQLESVREFALEQLAADPAELAATRDRHARFFSQLFAGVRSGVGWDAETAARFAQLDLEQHNVRAALRWLMQSGAASGALELAGALAPWWTGRGSLDEGRATLGEVLALPGASEPTRIRAHLLVWAAIMANFSADWRAVGALAEEALATARAVGDELDMVGALQQLAWLRMGSGDLPAAAHLFEEAASISQGMAAPWLEITCRVFLALMLLGVGDPARAQVEAQRALELSRTHGLTHEEARIQLALGLLAQQHGEAAAARRRLEVAVQRLQSGANRFWEAAALTSLARACADLRDLRAARTTLLAAARVGQALGRWPLWPAWLVTCAVVAAAESRPTDALRLAAAAEALVRGPAAAPILVRDVSDQWLEATRRAAGSAAGLAWVEGSTWSLEEAIAHGLAEAPAEAPRVSASLTPREREVVSLVAQGHTNRDIAQQLAVTEGTARVYVERILAKLELHSRAQLVVWALGHQTAEAPI